MSTYSWLKRITSIAVGVCFIVNTIAFSAPRNAYAEDVLSSQNENSRRFDPLDLIPNDAGTVKKVFIPGNISQGSRTPEIIHLEDAHANPEAQKNIREILKFLREKLDYRLIMLEASVGKIHPEYLRVFSGDREANDAVVESLAEMGEVTGAELYAYEKPDAVEFFGAEDGEAYRENLASYRELLKERENVKKALAELEGKTGVIVSRLANPKLRKFLRERESRKARSKLSMNDFETLRDMAFAELSIDLTDRAAQFENPNLTRMIFLLREEENRDWEKTGNEWSAVIEKLKEAGGQEMPELMKALEALAPSERESTRKADREGESRLLFERLYAAFGDRVDFKAYPEFLRYTAHLIAGDEIEADALFAEIESLENRIEAKIAVSETDKRIVSLLRAAGLLEKLVTLELTRKEYGEYVNTPLAGDPEAMSAELNELEAEAFRGKERRQDTETERAEELLGYQQRAEAFYAGAEAREKAVLGNILSRLEAAGMDKAVIVMGGFHGEGLDALLRERNIPFAVVRPKIKDPEKGAELYREVLLDRHAALLPTDGVNIASSGASTIGDALFTTDTADYASLRGNDKRPGLVWRALSGSDPRLKNLTFAARREAYAGWLGRMNISPAIPFQSLPQAGSLGLRSGADPAVDAENERMLARYDQIFASLKKNPDTDEIIKDFESEKISSNPEHFNSDKSPRTGDAVALSVFLDEQKDHGDLLANIREVKEAISRELSLSDDDIVWIPENCLHSLVFTPVKSFVTKKEAEKAESEDAIREVAKVVSPVGPFKIRWRGITLGDTGNILLQGFVESMDLSNLREDLKKRFPKNDFPDVFFPNIVHVTLGRFKKDIGADRFPALYDLIGRNREREMGETRVDLLSYVRATLTDGQRIGDETYKVLREFQLPSGETLQRVEDQLRRLAKDPGTALDEAKILDILAKVKSGALRLTDREADVIRVTPEGDEVVIGQINSNIAHAYADTVAFLHRTSNAFVATPQGKLLIQKRSADVKEPLKYSTIGCHVWTGMTYEEKIRKEITKTLGLAEDHELQGRLELVRSEGAFASPEWDVTNLERRSLYVYHATDEELSAARKIIAESDAEKFREMSFDELMAQSPDTLTSDLLAPLLHSPENADVVAFLKASLARFFASSLGAGDVIQGGAEVLKRVSPEDFDAERGRKLFLELDLKMTVGLILQDGTSAAGLLAYLAGVLPSLPGNISVSRVVIGCASKFSRDELLKIREDARSLPFEVKVLPPEVSDRSGILYGIEREAIASGDRVVMTLSGAAVYPSEYFGRNLEALLGMKVPAVILSGVDAGTDASQGPAAGLTFFSDQDFVKYEKRGKTWLDEVRPYLVRYDDVMPGPELHPSRINRAGEEDGSLLWKPSHFDEFVLTAPRDILAEEGGVHADLGLSRNGRVLLVEPHQDDYSLRATGLLTRFAERTSDIRHVQINVREGTEANYYWPPVFAERDEENRRAFELLGLGGKVSYQTVSMQNVQGSAEKEIRRIHDLLEATEPDILVLPGPNDSHRHHARIRYLMLKAAQAYVDRRGKPLRIFSVPLYSATEEGISQVNRIMNLSPGEVLSRRDVLDLYATQKQYTEGDLYESREALYQKAIAGRMGRDFPGQDGPVYRQGYLEQILEPVSRMEQGDFAVEVVRGRSLSISFRRNGHRYVFEFYPGAARPRLLIDDSERKKISVEDFTALNGLQAGFLSLIMRIDPERNYRIGSAAEEGEDEADALDWIIRSGDFSDWIRQRTELAGGLRAAYEVIMGEAEEIKIRQAWFDEAIENPSRPDAALCQAVAKEPHKLIIGIATHDSEEIIAERLRNIHDQIAEFPPEWEHWEVEIVLYSNGKEREIGAMTDRMLAQIPAEFFAGLPVTTAIVVRKEPYPNQSNSIHRIYEYAAEQKADMVLFTDDDIAYEAGATRAMIERLLSVRGPALVSGRFYWRARERSVLEREARDEAGDIPFYGVLPRTLKDGIVRLKVLGKEVWQEMARFRRRPDVPFSPRVAMGAGLLMWTDHYAGFPYWLVQGDVIQRYRYFPFVHVVDGARMSSVAARSFLYIVRKIPRTLLGYKYQLNRIYSRLRREIQRDGDNYYLRNVRPADWLRLGTADKFYFGANVFLVMFAAALSRFRFSLAERMLSTSAVNQSERGADSAVIEFEKGILKRLRMPLPEDWREVRMTANTFEIQSADGERKTYAASSLGRFEETVLDYFERANTGARGWPVVDEEFIRQLARLYAEEFGTPSSSRTENVVRVFLVLYAVPDVRAEALMSAFKLDRGGLRAVFGEIRNNGVLQELLTDHPTNRHYFSQLKTMIGKKEQTGAILEGTGIFPGDVELHPSIWCNLRCRFCYNRNRDPKNAYIEAREGMKKLEPEEWRFLVRGMALDGLKHIDLVGGLEPLLDLESSRAIIETAKENGITVSLFTNGYPIDIENEALVGLLLRLDSINISLRGGSAETHADIVGGRLEDLGELSRKIRFLADARGQAGSQAKISVNFVLVPENYTELPLMMDLARDAGADSAGLSTNNVMTRDEVNLRTDQQMELARLLANEFEMMRSGGKRQIAVKTNEPLVRMLKTYESGGRLSPVYAYTIGFPALCVNFWIRPIVNPYGGVYKCCVVGQPCLGVPAGIIGNVRDEAGSLRKVLERAHVHAFKSCPTCNPKERTGLAVLEKLKEDREAGIPPEHQPLMTDLPALTEAPATGPSGASLGESRTFLEKGSVYSLFTVAAVLLLAIAIFMTPAASLAEMSGPSPQSTYQVYDWKSERSPGKMLAQLPPESPSEKPESASRGDALKSYCYDPDKKYEEQKRLKEQERLREEKERAEYARIKALEKKYGSGIIIPSQMRTNPEVRELVVYKFLHGDMYERRDAFKMIRGAQDAEILLSILQHPDIGRLRYRKEERFLGYAQVDYVRKLLDVVQALDGEKINIPAGELAKIADDSGARVEAREAAAIFLFRTESEERKSAAAARWLELEWRENKWGPATNWRGNPFLKSPALQELADHKRPVLAGVLNEFIPDCSDDQFEQIMRAVTEICFLGEPSVFSDGITSGSMREVHLRQALLEASLNPDINAKIRAYIRELAAKKALRPVLKKILEICDGDMALYAVRECYGPYGQNPEIASFAFEQDCDDVYMSALWTHQVTSSELARLDLVLISEEPFVVKMTAALILLKENSAGAVSYLLESAQKGPDPKVRQTAARILGRVGDEAVRIELRKALESEKDSSVREEIKKSVRDSAKISAKNFVKAHALRWFLWGLAALCLGAVLHRLLPKKNVSVRFAETVVVGSVQVGERDDGFYMNGNWHENKVPIYEDITEKKTRIIDVRVIDWKETLAKVKGFIRGATTRLGRRPGRAKSQARDESLLRVLVEKADKPAPGLNVPLAQAALKEGRLEIEKIPSREIAEFLKFLKEHDITGIVVAGGAVRDIFFGKTSADIDIGIKLELAEEERAAFDKYAVRGNKRIYDYAMAQLTLLAAALNVPVERLLRPEPGEEVYFNGIEIQYAGPYDNNVVVETGKKAYPRRIVADTKTGKEYSGSTGASVLQMAIDADGKLYGHQEGLKDLLAGRAGVLGRPEGFFMGDILRLIRLKHEFGLDIGSSDELVRKKLADYRTGRVKGLKLTARELPVVERLIAKVLDTAKDREAAQADLDELGITELVNDEKKIAFMPPALTADWKGDEHASSLGEVKIVPFDLAEITKTAAEFRDNSQWAVDLHTVPNGPLKETLNRLDARGGDELAVVGGILRDLLIKETAGDVHLCAKVVLPEEEMKQFESDVRTLSSKEVFRKYRLGERSERVFRRAAKKMGVSMRRLEHEKERISGHPLALSHSPVIVGPYLVEMNTLGLGFTLSRVAMDAGGRIYQPVHGRSLEHLSKRLIETDMDADGNEIRIDPSVMTAIRGMRFKYQYEADGFRLSDRARRAIERGAREYRWYSLKDREPLLARLVSAARIFLKVFKDRMMHWNIPYAFRQAARYARREIFDGWKYRAPLKYMARAMEVADDPYEFIDELDRIGAIASLRAHGIKVDDFIRMKLHRTQDLSARSEPGQSLGTSGENVPERSANPLETWINDLGSLDEKVREEAVRRLARRSEPEAKLYGLLYAENSCTAAKMFKNSPDLIAGALNHPSFDIQLEAALALALLQDERAVPYLVAALGRASQQARDYRALNALAAMPTEEAKVYYYLGLGKGEFPGFSMEKHSEILAKALSHPSALLRLTAAVTLADFGDPRAAEPLIRLYFTHEAPLLDALIGLRNIGGDIPETAFLEVFDRFAANIPRWEPGEENRMAETLYEALLKRGFRSEKPQVREALLAEVFKLIRSTRRVEGGGELDPGRALEFLADPARVEKFVAGVEAKIRLARGLKEGMSGTWTVPEIGPERFREVEEFDSSVEGTLRAIKEDLGEADIVVTIPVFNEIAEIAGPEKMKGTHGQTIDVRNLVKTLKAALARYLVASKGTRALILVIGESKGDVAKAVVSAVRELSAAEETTEVRIRCFGKEEQFAGPAGKKWTMRAGMQCAKALNADFMVIDGDMTIDPDWVNDFMLPVRFGAGEYASADYLRYYGRDDIAIISHLTYPLFSAMFNRALRLPNGGEFGASKKLLDAFLNDPEIWTARIQFEENFAARAIAEGRVVRDVWCGEKIHRNAPLETNLDSYLEIAVTTLFGQMARHPDWWVPRLDDPKIVFRSERSLPPEAGDKPAEDVITSEIDMAGAVRDFREEYSANRAYYEKNFPGLVPVLNRLENSDEEKFDFSSGEWAFAVLSFLKLYLELRSEEARAELPKRLKPLFLARMVSFAVEVRAKTFREAETMLQWQAEDFAAEKGRIFGAASLGSGEITPGERARSLSSSVTAVMRAISEAFRTKFTGPMNAGAGIFTIAAAILIAVGCICANPQISTAQPRDSQAQKRVYDQGAQRRGTGGREAAYRQKDKRGPAVARNDKQANDGKSVPKLDALRDDPRIQSIVRLMGGKGFDGDISSEIRDIVKSNDGLLMLEALREICSRYDNYAKNQWYPDAIDDDISDLVNALAGRGWTKTDAPEISLSPNELEQLMREPAGRGFLKDRAALLLMEKGGEEQVLKAIDAVLQGKHANYDSLEETSALGIEETLEKIPVPVLCKGLAKCFDERKPEEVTWLIRHLSWAGNVERAMSLLCDSRLEVVERCLGQYHPSFIVKNLWPLASGRNVVDRMERVLMSEAPEEARRDAALLIVREKPEIALPHILVRQDLDGIRTWLDELRECPGFQRFMLANNPAVREALLDNLVRNQDSDARANAAKLIGDLGDRDVCPALQKALKGELDDNVRKQIKACIRHLNFTRNLVLFLGIAALLGFGSCLISVVRENFDKIIWLEIALLLLMARMRSGWAISRLIDRLGSAPFVDSDRKISDVLVRLDDRRANLYGLLYQGESDKVAQAYGNSPQSSLLNALEHGCPKVRKSAVFALARMGNADEKERLMRALDGRDSLIPSDEASEALVGLNDPGKRLLGLLYQGRVEEVARDYAGNPLLLNEAASHSLFRIRKSALLALNPLLRGFAERYSGFAEAVSWWKDDEKDELEMNMLNAFLNILPLIASDAQSERLMSKIFSMMSSTRSAKVYKYQEEVEVVTGEEYVRVYNPDTGHPHGRQIAVPVTKKIIVEKTDNILSGELIVEPSLEFMRDGEKVKTFLGRETPLGLRTDVALKALRGGRVDVDEIAENAKGVARFLRFLKEHGLSDIVVVGGSVRDIFLGGEVADIDIGIKIPLTESEREDYEDNSGYWNKRVGDYALAQLGRLADVLGVSVQDFLNPREDNKIFFDGLEIQYAGPVKYTDPDGKDYFHWGIVADAVSGETCTGNAGISVLKMAIDSEGNLYGSGIGLRDLLAGTVTIHGRTACFFIGEILRVLRLKHQYGFDLEQVYPLIRAMLAKYKEWKDLKIAETQVPFIENQINKILSTARKRADARKELKKLGIFELIERARAEGGSDAGVLNEGSNPVASSLGTADAMLAGIKAVQAPVGSGVMTEEVSREVIELFEQTGAMKDVRKRALFYYLLRTKKEPRLDGEGIVFEGVNGVRINAGAVLDVDERILKGIEVIGRGRLFEDIDENLAPREEEFPVETLLPVYHLAMYGILAPRLITDNEFKAAYARLEQFPEPVRGFIDLYADGSANHYAYDPAAGKHAVAPGFREKIGAFISEEDFDAIRGQDLAGSFLASWQPFLRELRILLREFEERGRLPDMRDVSALLDDLAARIDRPDLAVKNLNDMARIVLGREDAQGGELVGALHQVLSISEPEERRESLAEIVGYLKDETPHFSEWDDFRFHQVLAVTEVIRLLNSDSAFDQKEKNDLLSKFVRDGEKDLVIELRSSVQVALKPIRPRIIRDHYADYFVKKAETAEKFGGVGLYKGGTTTLNVKRRGISKANAVRYAVTEDGIPAEEIFFAGDEMLLPEVEDETQAGVDDAVAKLQQEPGLENLIVLNTGPRRQDAERRPLLRWTAQEPLTGGKYGTEANGILLNFILSEGIEKQIERLLADPAAEVRSAISVLRSGLRKGPGETAEPGRENAAWDLEYPELEHAILTRQIGKVFNFRKFFPEKMDAFVNRMISGDSDEGAEPAGELMLGTLLEKDLSPIIDFERFLRSVLERADDHDAFVAGQAAYYLGRISRAAGSRFRAMSGPDDNIGFLLGILESERRKTGAEFNFRTVGHVLQALDEMAHAESVSGARRKEIMETFMEIAEDHGAADRPGYYRDRIKAIYLLRNYTHILPGEGNGFEEEVYELFKRITLEHDPLAQVDISTHLSVGASGSDVRDLRYSAAVALYQVRRERGYTRLKEYYDKQDEEAWIRSDAQYLWDYYGKVEWKQTVLGAVLLLLEHYSAHRDDDPDLKKSNRILKDFARLLTNLRLSESVRMTLLPVLDHPVFMRLLSDPRTTNSALRVLRHLADLYMKLRLEAVKGNDATLERIYPVLQKNYADLTGRAHDSKGAERMLEFLALCRARFWKDEKMCRDFEAHGSTANVADRFEPAAVVGSGGNGSRFFAGIFENIAADPEFRRTLETVAARMGQELKEGADAKNFPLAYFFETLDDDGASRLDRACLLIHWGIMALPPGDFMNALTASVFLWKSHILDQRLPIDRNDFYEGHGVGEILEKGIELSGRDSLIEGARRLWEEDIAEHQGRVPTEDERKEFEGSIGTLRTLVGRIDANMVHPDDPGRSMSLSGRSIRNLVFTGFMMENLGYSKDLIDSYGVVAGLRSLTEWLGISYRAFPLHSAGTVMAFRDQYGYVYEEQSGYSHVPPIEGERVTDSQFIFRPLISLVPEAHFFADAPLVFLGLGSSWTSFAPHVAHPDVINYLHDAKGQTVLFINPKRDEESAGVSFSEFLEVSKSNFKNLAESEALSDYFKWVLYHDWHAMRKDRASLEEFLAVLWEPLNESENAPENSHIRSLKAKAADVRTRYEGREIGGEEYLAALNQLLDEVLRDEESGNYGALEADLDNLFDEGFQANRVISGNLLAPLSFRINPRRPGSKHLLMTVVFNEEKIASLLIRKLPKETWEAVAERYVRGQKPAEGASLGTAGEAPEEVLREEPLPRAGGADAAEKRVFGAAFLFAAGFVNLDLAMRTLRLAKGKLRELYEEHLCASAGSGEAAVPVALRSFNQGLWAGLFHPWSKSRGEKAGPQPIPFIVPYEALVSDPLRAADRAEIETTAHLMASVLNEGDRLVILWPKGNWKNAKPLISALKRCASGKFQVLALPGEGLSPSKLARSTAGYPAPGVLIRLGRAEEISGAQRLSVVNLDPNALKGYDLRQVVALIRKISDEDIRERERLYRDVAQFDILRSGAGGLVATAGERFVHFVDSLYRSMMARQVTAQAA